MEPEPLKVTFAASARPRRSQFGDGLITAYTRAIKQIEEGPVHMCGGLAFVDSVAIRKELLRRIEELKVD